MPGAPCSQADQEGRCPAQGLWYVFTGATSSRGRDRLANSKEARSERVCFSFPSKSTGKLEGGRWGP